MSFVSPYALLFFGKTRLTTTNDDDEEEILIDQWIRMKIDRQTNILIDDLKEKFSNFLEKKVSKRNFGVENEKIFLNLIVDFITKLSDENSFSF